ncbi:MAG TPA: hypothetical protein VGI97_14780 [Gemmatimonadaceae bacterium]|jgi:hypothetical protein
MARRDEPNRSLVQNAGDPEQVKEAEQFEKFAKARRMNAYRAMLATPEGRELAAYFMNECSVFTPMMTTSPYIFENAGKQGWGLQIMGEMIEADAALYFKMQMEAMTRNRNMPVPKPSKDGDETDA